MKPNNLELVGLDIMGENLRSKVKYCGEGVRLYPLCKMIRPEIAERLPTTERRCHLCVPSTA